MLSKVTSNQVTEFLKAYNAGVFQHLRLGQAFLNHFKLDCNELPCSESDGYCLFHEMNNAKAAGHIWTNRIDYQL